MITLNGRLTFKQEDGFKDALHLRCKQLFIRQGELIIGTSDKRFATKATITLFGEYNERTVAYSNSIYAGNKLIANLNLIQMYGTVPAKQMVRLLEEVKAGAESIKLDAGLSDWLVGDKIWLAPTSYDALASDYNTIKAIDQNTGVVTLETKLKHYHFGADRGTEGTYNDVVDIRCEVVLLSRNVRIVGDNGDVNKDWGGQMVTSDFLEASGVER